MGLAVPLTVEQHADRGQVLLDRRLLMRTSERLEVRADMERLDLDQIGNALGLAPGEEVEAGAAVRGARVVARDRGEEIGVAARRLVAGIGDKLRHDDRPAKGLAASRCNVGCRDCGDVGAARGTRTHRIRFIKPLSPEGLR